MPWALILEKSQDVYIVGAGLYSWFYDNYDQSCLKTMTCQRSLVSIDDASTASIYNLFTVGATEMVSRGKGKPIFARDNKMLANESPWTSVIAAWIKADAKSVTASPIRATDVYVFSLL